MVQNYIANNNSPEIGGQLSLELVFICHTPRKHSSQRKIGRK